MKIAFFPIRLNMKVLVKTLHKIKILFSYYLKISIYIWAIMDILIKY